MTKDLALHLQLLGEPDPEHVLLALSRQQNVPEAVVLVVNCHVVHGVERLLVVERGELLHDGRDLLGVAQAPDAHELEVDPSTARSP